MARCSLRIIDSPNITPSRPKSFIRRSFNPTHRFRTLPSANGSSCVATMPAMPFSRSHHHHRFANPAQCPVPFDLPVASAFGIMNVMPQP
ncbi:hypothetical protein HYQ45_014023 [Verticillium longisporum]|uniref:Uncharacterized protein n=1 Tax=Verticillium longisporum TaxID=100787 RepID=A0A8I2ZBE0_VERLO|nr:hypothetical protein HYQ45_014023 [Verticillium longisporum]